ncbi:MAG: DMT family transporter [Bacteroidetes bacterium]|nr:MAG: DMT family transporter [Bacteroidota bacterium]
MPADSTSWRYDAVLLFVVAVWGLNFPILKGALAAMHPHVLNLFRFTVSGLVLGGLYVHRQHRAGQSVWAPLRTHARQIIVLGLVGYLFYQLCFIIGIDLTTAGNAALLMASSPLWTAALSHVFGLDVLRPAAWLGLLLSLAGTALVVVAGSQTLSFSNETFLGNLLMLLAAMLWGAYTAFNKPTLDTVSPIGLTFLGLLFAFPFLAALSIPYFDTVHWSEVDAGVWMAIVYSGGLSTGLAVALWNMGVKAVGPSNTAVYGNLVPLLALVSSAWLLHEPVTLAQVLGGTLIVSGLLLMRWVRQKAVSAAPPVP